MDRRAALLALVVALGLGIWFLNGTLTGVEAPGGPISDPATMCGNRATPRMVEESADPVTAQGPVEREALADEAGALDPEARLFPVRVVREAGRAPVPGAEVSYFEYADILTAGDEAQFEFRQLRHDQEAVARRFGTTVFADTDGLVSIPVRDTATVTGRHEGLYGQIYLGTASDADTEHEILLEEDHSVGVQVLDNHGTPAVGVSLQLIPQWEREADRTFGDLFMGMTTAPEGLTELAHLQLLAPTWRARGPAPTDYLIRPYVPGIVEGGAPLDLEELPSENIVLQLPPTGRVVVRPVDPEGNPILDPGTVRLRIPVPGEDPDLHRIPITSNEGWQVAREAGAPAIFDRVVLGRTYEARTNVSITDLRKTFAGPAREGQEVVVALSIDDGTVTLVGRALDEGFQPLREKTLHFRFDIGRSSGGLHARTDRDGRFRIFLRAAEANMRLQYGSFELLPEVLTGVVMDGPAVLSILEPRALEAGETDLGDVVLRPGPLVVAGRILVDGEPQKGGQWMGISVERSRTPRDWMQVRNLSIRQLVGGRFEVRGELDEGNHRLRIQGQGYLPVEPVAFAPGEDDLELQLFSGGSVRATVLADDRIRAADLYLELEPTEDQVPGRETAEDPFEGSESILALLIANAERNQQDSLGYLWRAVWPGRYDLHVKVRSEPQPVRTLRDVQVASGEETDDPRLQDIDLRGELRVLSLELVDSDSEPIVSDFGEEPVVLIHSDEPGSTLTGFEAQNGFARVATTQPYLDLLATARGYRPQVLRGVREDLTVRMEPYPEVTVRIAGGMPALPGGVTLRVSVRDGSPTHDSRRYTTYLPHRGGRTGGIANLLRSPTSAVAVDGTGSVRVPFGRDGMHRLRVSLLGSDRRSRTIEGTTPGEIDLQASRSPLMFEVRIPMDSLARTLREAGY